MKKKRIHILYEHTLQNIYKSGGTKSIIIALNVLLLTALLTAFLNLQKHNHTVGHFGEEVRERWEASPDKHPHRMAHYGYVAFRNKYPLSFFDFGMDSFLGNAVFLEAHRQNTINFSEASLSNSLLRFGEMSAAMIFQLLLPLLIFFWGFALIAGERESGTLRLLLSQEVEGKEVMIGRSLGLFFLSLTVFLPTILVTFILLLFISFSFQVILTYFLLVIGYASYLFLISLLTIWASAKSQNSKSALVGLIGCWLFFTLLLPKIAQVTGQLIYPSPSKIEFDTAIENELIKHGDSHNPEDPHFLALRDSLLETYQVGSTDDLPFNYSGFIMREGEKLSTEAYRRHQSDLHEVYEKQKNLLQWSAFVNPYIAIRNLSMALAGTGFQAYANFQSQSERYRYDLAQTMNELQIKYISNKTKTSADKKAVISKEFWKEFPDFEHKQLNFLNVIQNAWPSFLALLMWILGLILFAFTSSKNLKAF